jgi:acetyltransferase-like isoleucine patch superfamily enzyme
MLGKLLELARRADLVYWRLRAKVQFRRFKLTWPDGLTVKGPMGLYLTGKVKLGRRLTIINHNRYYPAGINHPTQIEVWEGAELQVGDDVGLSGATIFCVEKISIGNNVRFGVNCSVYDTDFHPVDFQQRRTAKGGKTAPVVIEDDVWLCGNVTVLKGVTIGARSIITVGSVVNRDIPPDTLAGGLPARPIKSLL